MNKLFFPNLIVPLYLCNLYYFFLQMFVLIILVVYVICQLLCISILQPLLLDLRNDVLILSRATLGRDGGFAAM